MRLRKAMWSLLPAVFIGYLAHPPATGAQEDATIQGEIVDLECYIAKGSHGAEHKTCAQMCAKKGAPIGVLTDSGQVFLLLHDHSNSDPYEAAKKLAGERAEVSGKKFSKQGIPSIVVGSVKAL
jgi:hypothetical protein